MDNVANICFLCLNDNIKVQSVLIEDNDGIVVNEKLRYFFSEIIDSTPDAHKLACLECLEKVRISYDFKQLVLRHNTAFRDYIDKCLHKSYEELLVSFVRSKHQSIIPFTRDFTENIDEKCGEEHNGNNFKFQNENLNLTYTNQEQPFINTPEQSCQSATNENDVLFTKFNSQTEEINLKTENAEIEEVFIKEEPHDDFSGNYLEENSKESEGNINKCQTCHLSFSSLTYLENHTNHCNKQIKKPERNVSKKIGDNIVSNHDNSASYKCHLCDNMYTIKSLYERHLLVKHCLYEYDKKQRRNTKINQNNRRKNTDSTSNDSDYTDQPKQAAPNKRMHKCSVCNKAFTRPYYLEKHSRIHSGEKPFECEICHKTFTESGNLKKHQLTHTGEKKHSCDICQKSFNRNNKLIAHKRSHDNVRPYQCSVCKKTFTQTSILTRHMITHTGQKPYHCNICQYKCTQAGDLNKHITRTHTGEKPYGCKQCWKSYSWPSDLKEHVKKYHNEENA